MTKRGFTLVELSIVLVIIGLLIGGILVAQSMIETAKIQSFIRQIQQIDMAVSNFRVKYNYLPGDDPKHSAAGDGDGRIEDSAVNAAGSSPSYYFNYEISNFWVHLQQDGFLRNDYPTFSADASSGIDVGTHIPYAQGTSSKNAGIVIYYSEYFTHPRNEYFICDYTPTTNTTWSSGTYWDAVFTPVQALSIDTKMDDGLSGRASSPSIYAYDGDVWATYTSGVAGECYVSAASDVYLTNNNLECCIMIRMLSQSGGAQ
ncbi:MAG: hypothetical protein COV36_07155 [Alphaproteobacteria bacterium CG11_big_fil_rev_8_21_14_0_20_44_7]|nr:MAG: hypothetical protein COV36_07155 [Alphaproteobacteria bacterium CG11_big_fil_rev_8_21_14_0_20_44_7]